MCIYLVLSCKLIDTLQDGIEITSLRSLKRVALFGGLHGECKVRSGLRMVLWKLEEEFRCVEDRKLTEGQTWIFISQQVFS